MVHKCQVRFILNFRQCFSFKKSSFKCPVLLTFSYIFYSVFEEDNNLCLILGNSCKDNEILMIFHQVKCELQKKSYWIFMDLNRIKWDSWGIRITILSGPSKAAVPAWIHCVEWGAALASDRKQFRRAGSAQGVKYGRNLLLGQQSCLGSALLSSQLLIYLMIKNLSRWAPQLEPDLICSPSVLIPI